MDIDRIKELADNEAIDELGDGYKAGPFELLNGPELENFRYDAESWHSDCADYLIGSMEDNDYIRHQIAEALKHLAPLGYQQSPRGKLLAAQCLNQYMANIGEMIIENAIKNGLTLEKVGV